MMEIKFRAWDKQAKVMREVIQINFRERKVYCPQYFLNDWGFDDVEIMQFAGHDRNGKDVYDGDFFQWNLGKIESIKWDEELNGWNIDTIGLSTGEVIGNIYENQELPKEENK